MLTVSTKRWSLAGLTLLIWTLAAVSLVYWGLKLSSAGRLNAPALVAAAPAAPDPLAVARLLGATATLAVPQAELASRFSLQGVVAGAPRGGAALIAVDAAPARPFRVGTAVDEGLLLQSITARQAKLGTDMNGPTLVTLDMPLLKN